MTELSAVSHRSHATVALSRCRMTTPVSSAIASVDFVNERFVVVVDSKLGSRFGEWSRDVFPKESRPRYDRASKTWSCNLLHLAAINAFLMPGTITRLIDFGEARPSSPQSSQSPSEGCTPVAPHFDTEPPTPVERQVQSQLKPNRMKTLRSR